MSEWERLWVLVPYQLKYGHQGWHQILFGENCREKSPGDSEPTTAGGNELTHLCGGKGQAESSCSMWLVVVSAQGQRALGRPPAWDPCSERKAWRPGTQRKEAWPLYSGKYPSLTPRRAESEQMGCCSQGCSSPHWEGGVASWSCDHQPLRELPAWRCSWVPP